MLRADGLLRQPSPLFQDPSRSNGVPPHPHAYYPKRKVPITEDEMDDEAVERRDAAVELVAEMRLTSEQLKVGLCRHASAVATALAPCYHL